LIVGLVWFWLDLVVGCFGCYYVWFVVVVGLFVALVWVLTLPRCWTLGRLFVVVGLLLTLVGWLVCLLLAFVVVGTLVVVLGWLYVLGLRFVVGCVVVVTCWFVVVVVVALVAF